METQSKVFSYKGNLITFSNDGTVMVNATEMAKPFEKSATHWLRNQSTQEFISTYAELRNCNSTDLVKVTHGDNGGTWMHEDVALEFARWLSPAFAIWCNDRIKELITTGKTQISQLSRKQLAQMIIEAEEEKERLALENQRQQETIELQQAEITKSAPKVSYYDTTLQSVNTMTSTQVAKQIGMDAEKLHKKLKEAGVIFRQSGQWMLHAPYSTWGMHATRTQTYTRSDGSTGTSTYTVWTEKGRRFIIALHDNAWNVRKAVKQIKGEQAAA